MRDSRHKYKKKRKKNHFHTPSWGELKENDEEVSVVGCEGKRRYPDLISAHAAAHHMSTLKGDAEVYLYLCEGCGGYHLTKAPVSPDGKLNRWAYFFGKD